MWVGVRLLSNRGPPAEEIENRRPTRLLERLRYLDDTKGQRESAQLMVRANKCIKRLESRDNNQIICPIYFDYAHSQLS